MADVAERVSVEKRSETPDIVCRCKVVGLKLYAVKDCPVEFDIVLKDCCVNKMDGNRLPAVTMYQRSARGNMEESPVKVTDNSNGTYTVVFVPEREGKIEIHVCVTEVPIMYSPMEMRCRDYSTIECYKYCIETDCKVDHPRTIACGPKRNWAVCDGEHVYVFISGHCVNKIACPGGNMQFPAGLEFRSSDCFYMISSIGCVVQEYNIDGENILNFTAPLDGPHQPRSPPLCASAVVLHKEKVYATDPQDGKIIRVFQLDGKQVGAMDTKCTYPAGLAISGAGHLLITDYEQHCVHTLSLSGEHLRKFAENIALLRAPKGITTDAYGCVFVCSTGTDNIMVFNPKGTLIHFFGGLDQVGSSLSLPSSVAVDDSGKIYVADRSSGNQILVF